MSLAMRMSARILKTVNRGTLRTMTDGPAYLASRRPDRTAALPPRSLRRHGTIECRRVRNSRVCTFTPSGARPDTAVLYVPGGAYVNPMVTPQWWIVRRIALQNGVSVTVADYPRAPEHNSDETVPVLDAAWEEVCGIPGVTHAFVAGDSAGGHAAITLALRHRHEEPLRPRGVLLISPWLDLGLRSPSAREREPRDPMLRVNGARECGRVWAQPHGTDYAPFSPLTADLHGVPPVLLAIGENDILYSDAVHFAHLLRQSAVDIELITEADGFHVYPGAVWTPESRRAFRAMQMFFSRHTPARPFG